MSLWFPTSNVRFRGKWLILSLHEGELWYEFGFSSALAILLIKLSYTARKKWVLCTLSSPIRFLWLLMFYYIHRLYQMGDVLLYPWAKPADKICESVSINSWFKNIKIAKRSLAVWIFESKWQCMVIATVAKEVSAAKAKYWGDCLEIDMQFANQRAIQMSRCSYNTCSSIIHVCEQQIILCLDQLHDAFDMNSILVDKK